MRSGLAGKYGCGWSPIHKFTRQGTELVQTSLPVLWPRKLLDSVVALHRE